MKLIILFLIEDLREKNRLQNRENNNNIYQFQKKAFIK